MEQENYIQGVAMRLGDLNPEELKPLIEVTKTPGFATVLKIVGPEVSNLMQEVFSQIEEAMPQEQPKMGLGARK